MGARRALLCVVGFELVAGVAVLVALAVLTHSVHFYHHEDFGVMLGGHDVVQYYGPSKCGSKRAVRHCVKATRLLLASR